MTEISLIVTLNNQFTLLYLELKFEPLFKPRRVSRVCETRMPQQGQNMANSLSPKFWSAPPLGACDASEPLDELIVQVWLL